MTIATAISVAACLVPPTAVFAQGPSTELIDESAPAGADAEARALFEAGRVAFDAGRYEDALKRWQEAYELSGGRAALLYNIGLAHDRLRHDDQAIAAFEGFLAAHPGSARTDEVRGRIRAMRAAKAVPKPSEVAREAAPVQPPLMPATENEPRDEASSQWYEQWWVWTVAGVLVAGGVIGAVVLASGEEEAAAVEPDTGVSVLTLRH